MNVAGRQHGFGIKTKIDFSFIPTEIVRSGFAVKFEAYCARPGLVCRAPMKGFRDKKKHVEIIFQTHVKHFNIQTLVGSLFTQATQKNLYFISTE